MMAQFAEFNPQQKYTILKKMGYSGSTQTDEMEAFMQSKPDARSLVQKLERKARQMQGVPSVPPENRTIGMASGGVIQSVFDNNKAKEDAAAATDAAGEAEERRMVVDDGTESGESSLGSMTTAESVTSPDYSYADPNAEGTVVETEPEVTAEEAAYDTVTETSQAEAPDKTDAVKYEATTTEGDVRKVVADTKAAQGTVSDKAQVEAAQQTESSVSDLEAAQGEAYLMENPVQREIQDGELISGVANAEKAAKFTEQIEAATATPSEKATVQGQLEGLMSQFEGGKTPSWAAGAMRAATASLAARGLSASSMAGQAVIQAAMESALPIAQADAATQASFEAQNLSNRQQRAMLAAQQRAEFIGQEFDQEFQARVANSARIGDIANMNFTAEQNIALENSRAVNSMNLQNLSNSQALILAEASALSGMDLSNLNNRQQAAVQNAQAFLGMDMANLSNEQQTSLFNAQQIIQSLFTDQSAENAAAQFNSASENQTNQFFADLGVNVSKFNADQQNAIKQFNTNAANATYQFNTAQNNAMKQFNVTNSLVIAQANAKWRQTASLTNQEAANERALYVAKEMNALSQAELDEIWQRERDEMDYIYNAYQNDQDRSNAVILAKLAGDATMDAAKLQAEIGANQEVAEAVFNWLFKP